MRRSVKRRLSSVARRLGEAKPEDTAEYLRHRLEAAGATTELFDSEAVALLHEATEGRLREIDRIGTEALRIGARKKLKRIDRHVITAVAGGLDSDDD
jgi:type II secretory pathway predicted ATPase ExeA